MIWTHEIYHEQEDGHDCAQPPYARRPAATPGFGPKTQQCYLEAVKHLAPYHRRAPDQISEEEIRQYCLYVINEKKVAESTLRIHLYGIRFFYERTLQRPWPVFELIHPWHRQSLPVVLSPQEVRSLLALVQRSKAGSDMHVMLLSRCHATVDPKPSP
jgi:site-specific recombinase XerD